MLQLGNGCSCAPCKQIFKPTVCPSPADICAGKAKCERKCPCPKWPMLGGCMHGCSDGKTAKKSKDDSCELILKPTVCPSPADICAGKAKCERKCPCPKCKPMLGGCAGTRHGCC